MAETTEKPAAKQASSAAHFIARKGEFAFRFASSSAGKDHKSFDPAREDGKACFSSDEKTTVRNPRLVAQCRRYCERNILEEVESSWRKPKKKKAEDD